MNPMRTIKRHVLATKGLGLFRVVANSSWRRERLLILCYHGVSMRDEHAFHPEMFLPLETFARRMEILKQLGCNVLALSEALQLLKESRLPPRSVCITFDDGWADFVNAYPILNRYGFPATVYLTTYYCVFNRPIFRLALGYMMWKCKEQVINNHRLRWLPPQLDLGTSDARAALVGMIDEYAKTNVLTGKQKDDLARQFADLLGFDYGIFVRERVLCLMSPAEVSEMSLGGVDFQLHTHRHRTPLDRVSFIAEVEENRRLIHDMTNRPSEVTHFCYPSGAHRPEFLPWLTDAGVYSATTCVGGVVSKIDNFLLLPRLLDQYRLSDDEFESWVTGFSALIPRKNVPQPDVAPE